MAVAKLKARSEALREKSKFKRFRYATAIFSEIFGGPK
jgi:hypothetical protein